MSQQQLYASTAWNADPAHTARTIVNVVLGSLCLLFGLIMTPLLIWRSRSSFPIKAHGTMFQVLKSIGYCVMQVFFISYLFIHNTGLASFVIYLPLYFAFPTLYRCINIIAIMKETELQMQIADKHFKAKKLSLSSSSLSKLPSTTKQGNDEPSSSSEWLTIDEASLKKLAWFNRLKSKWAVLIAAVTLLTVHSVILIPALPLHFLQTTKAFVTGSAVNGSEGVYTVMYSFSSAWIMTLVYAVVIVMVYTVCIARSRMHRN